MVDGDPAARRLCSTSNFRTLMVWAPGFPFINDCRWELDRGMPQDAAAILQEILGEVDALILQRLKDEP
jgi:hypothetical protein